MNISSLIVKTLPEKCAEAAAALSAGGFCEVHHAKNGTIIVTIEGEDVSDELRKLKQVEQSPFVLSATMIYSFCEDELESERDKLNRHPDYPDWLNDDRVKAGDIRYSGDLRNHGLK